MFDNKKILILGMARSGYSCAKVLAEHNASVTVTDMKEQDKDKVNELESLGVNVVITEDPLPLLDSTVDYVIKNPGIKLDHPICLKAEELGIKVLSELEVAFEYMPKVNIIGITGSNGKTTTTTLIYELLKNANKRVHLGGNIGYPVCSLVSEVKEDDILVLEVSGHQLHDCYNFKTNVSVMTNLTPVHIDHFGSFENYKFNKAKIFNHHTDDDIAIYNIGDKNVVEKVEKIPSHKISFTAQDGIKSDLYLKDNKIYYHDEEIIDTKDIILKGNHNYENIMCAIAATFNYGVTKENVYDVLSKFNGVEHRIEYVRTINDVEFYNDSKATNVKSTQIALSAFNKNTILLLGGLDRGHSFDELEEYMKNVSLVVCYGQTKERINDFCNKINIKCIIKDDLESSIKCAYENSSKNTVILLSPACASWDQFDSFEQRGNLFKDVVNSL